MSNKFKHMSLKEISFGPDTSIAIDPIGKFRFKYESPFKNNLYYKLKKRIQEKKRNNDHNN